MLRKTNVAQEDIEAVAHPVLHHRLIVNFTAEAEGIGSKDVILKILEHARAHPSK